MQLRKRGLRFSRAWLPCRSAGTRTQRKGLGLSTSFLCGVSWKAPPINTSCRRPTGTSCQQGHKQSQLMTPPLCEQLQPSLCCQASLSSTSTRALHLYHCKKLENLASNNPRSDFMPITSSASAAAEVPRLGNATSAVPPNMNKLPVVGQTPCDAKGSAPQDTPTPLCPLDDKKPPIPLQVYHQTGPSLAVHLWAV